MLKIIILLIALIGDFNLYEACFVYVEPQTTTTTSPITTTTRKIVMDSAILSSQEIDNLHDITGYRGSLTLLYRASRDGFKSQSFHSRCSDKEKTITIIKSTLNYVFGGYTSVPWNKNIYGYSSDSFAYLFSLRVNGSSTSFKYPLVYSYYAIYNNYYNYGPTFGGGHDIYISDYSNLYQNSYTYCHSYQCPSGVSTYSRHSKLAGSSYFKVAEIEVYQMN